MTPDTLILLAGALSFATYVYGYLTGRCSKVNPCPKCPYHVNEQRVERMEAERKRVEEVQRQQDMRHDAEHKGWGWATNQPDQYNCADDSCSRNAAGRGRGL